MAKTLDELFKEQEQRVKSSPNTSQKSVTLQDLFGEQTPAPAPKPLKSSGIPSKTRFDTTSTPTPTKSLTTDSSFGGTQSSSFGGQPVQKGIIQRLADKVKKPAEAVASFFFEDKMAEARKDYEARLKREAEVEQFNIEREQRKQPDKFSIKPLPVTKVSTKFDPIKIAEHSPDIGEVDVKQPLRSAVGSFSSGALSSVEGMVGAVEWLGADSAKPVADKLKTWSEQLMPEDASFAEQLVSGAGSAAVFFIPGLGAMRATTFFSAVSPKLAVLFGNSVSTALEAATEAGMVYRDLRAQGKTESEARLKAGATFASNAVLIFLTNKYGIFGDNVESTLKHGLESALSEGGQEGIQQIISNLSTGKPVLEGVGMSTAIGSIIGGGLGTFTNINPQEAVDSLHQAPVGIIPQEDTGGEEPPPASQLQPVKQKEFISNGNTDENLNKAIQLYKTTAIDQPGNVAIRDLVELTKQPAVQDIVQKQVDQAIEKGTLKLNEDGTLTVYRVGDPKSERLVSTTFSKEYAKLFSEDTGGKINEVQIKPSDIQVFIGKDESEILVKPDVFPKLKTELPPIVEKGVEEKVIDQENLKISVKQLDNGKYIYQFSASNGDLGMSTDFQKFSDQFDTREEAISTAKSEIKKTFDKEPNPINKKNIEKVRENNQKLLDDLEKSKNEAPQSSITKVKEDTSTVAPEKTVKESITQKIDKLAKEIVFGMEEEGQILKLEEVDRIVKDLTEEEYNDLANAVSSGDREIILNYLGKMSDEVLKPSKIATEKVNKPFKATTKTRDADHKAFIAERDRAGEEYKTKYPIFEVGAVGLDENVDKNLIVEVGDYIVDRNGQLLVVTAAADNGTDGFFRATYFNTKEITQSDGTKVLPDWLGYANQSRMALAGELEQVGLDPALAKESKFTEPPAEEPPAQVPPKKVKITKKGKERFDNFMAGVREDMADDPERDFAAIFYGRGITFNDDIEALYEYAKTADPGFARLMENGLLDSQKSGIIDTNGQQPDNLRGGAQPGQVFEDVGVGAEGQGGAGEGNQPTNAGEGLQRPSRRAVGAGVGYVPSVELNGQIEALVAERGDDPNDYSEDEKDMLRQYTGAGGLESKGAEGRGLLDEYYTPPDVVKLVWQMVGKQLDLNQEGLNVLEPSVGIGNFITNAPNNIQRLANIEGFEINETSATIAQILYPNAGIEHAPFESLFMTNNGSKKTIKPIYDLAIGNPPYGEHRGFYKGLGEEPQIPKYEEYVMKRSLDLVKEGGVVAMVVPSGFLAGAESEGKRRIANLGKLVDAYRLPNGVFGTTEIGTDIVIFKKGIGYLTIKDITGDTYFKANPDKVLGETTERRGRFGMERHIKGTIENVQAKIETEKVSMPTKQPKTLKEKIVTKTTEKKISVKKKIANKQVTSISTKKGTTMNVTPDINLSEQEAELWKHVSPTGELSAEFQNSFKGKSIPAGVNYAGNEWFNDFNYLQGNIHQKLTQLENDKGQISPEQYNKQKKALEAILPTPVTIDKIILSPQDDLISEITLQSGNTLKQDFRSFIEDLPYEAFGGSSSYEIRSYMNKESVRGGDKERNALVSVRRREVGNRLFNRFIKEQLESEDKDKIAKAYNEKRNANHQPNYNNVPIQAPIHSTFKGIKLALRYIQRAGAAFLINKGVGGLAHEVGGGKTLTSIIAVNEMVHKGWTKKPLFVVEKNNYTKWLKEIEEIVPGVVINKLANLGSKFKGDLATLDVPDGSYSVMTVEGFQRIGFSEQTYNDLTSELKDVISDINTEPKTKRWNAKFDQQIEEKKGKAMQKISGDRNFEDLGFDTVVLDEAHIYKNLFTSAKTKEAEGNEYKNVRGGTSSTRAIKAFFATQYILKKNSGRGVIMLTATPFTNSPIEFYSMLSFMARNRLTELGLTNVNDFMTAFMDLTTTFKVKANQEIQSSDVIERFRNAQQLRKLINEFFDFKGGEEMGVIRPKKINKQFFVNPTQRQIDLMIDAEKLLQSQNAPVLQYINELMNITISPYLSQFETRQPADAKKFVEESPKIKLLMEMISQLKKDNPEGGRIIHSPRGIGFHNLIKEYLVKNVGYKENQVEILSGAVKRTEEQVDDIRAKFNAGDVKIIIGGDTIQRGIDLQENTTHVFRLTLPYRPDEITQIEGRAWRHGNQWKNLMSGLIMMNNSIDPFLNQTLETKDRRIKEAQKKNENTIEIGGDVNFEELKMQTITDPVKKLKAEKTFAVSKENKALSEMTADLGFISQKFQQYTEAVDKVESAKMTLKHDEERLQTGIANQEAPESIERYKGWVEDQVASVAKAEARVLEVKAKLTQAGDFETVKTNIDQKRETINAKEAEVSALEEKYDLQIESMQGAPVVVDKEKVNDYATTVAELAEINKTFFEKHEKIEEMPLESKKRSPSGMASSGSRSIGTFENLMAKEKPTDNSFKLAEKSLEIIKKYAERVGEGYTPRRAVGVLFPKTGNIRVDSLNDLSTVTHETVHYLDVKSGIVDNLIAETGHGERIRRIMTNLYEEYYPTGKRTHTLKKRMEEGLATLIQKYVEQPSVIASKYPMLVKEILMPNGRFYDPIFTEFIKDIRGIVSDYQGLSALDKVNARIIDGKTPINKTKFLNPLEMIRTVIADAIFPIEKVAKKAGVWMTNNDPSLWLRQFNQYSSIFTNNVLGKRGYYSFRNGNLKKLFSYNWGTLEKTSKENNTAVDFNAYLIARDQFFNYEHLDELSEEIRNSPVNDGFLTDPAEMERIKDLEEERDALKAVLDRNGFTLDEVVNAYEQNKDRFVEEEKMFDGLGHADLDLEHDPEVQLLDDESFTAYDAKKGYASMKRETLDEFASEEGSATAPTPGRTQISSLIRRRGSQKSILSPVESGIRNHQEVLKKSLKQVVYNKITKIAFDGSLPDIFQVIPLEVVVDTHGRISYPQEKDPKIIMGRMNYKRVPVLVHEDIKTVIDDVLTYQNISMFEQAAITSARIFTKSTTAGYILFAPVNVLLDQPSAFINTKNNYIPLFDSVKVLGKALMQKDSLEHQYYMEYLVSGGMQQTLAGSHDMTQEELRDAITKEAEGLNKIIDLIGQGVDILSIPSQASEIHTRAIEYIKARMNGKPFVVAREEAGRITAPFHHMGSWKLKPNTHSAKAYIKTIAFFNAGIQVMDQLARTAQESPEGRKRIAITMMVVTAAVLTSQALLMGLGNDDDKNDYLDLSPEELAGYLWFPNPLGKGLIKIRVSETLSGLPYMINMMILNSFYGGNYHLEDFIDVATAGVPEQFNPTDFIPFLLSWTPTQLKTIGELVFEKKTFPDVHPMITQRLQNLPPELQAYEWTANYAKALGGLLGISPIKIEHLVTGFAGRGIKQFIAPGTIGNPFTKDSRLTAGRRLQEYYDIKNQTEADRSAILKKLKTYSPKEKQLINKRYALIQQVETLLDAYELTKDNEVKANIFRTRILERVDKIIEAE